MDRVLGIWNLPAFPDRCILGAFKDEFDRILSDLKVFTDFKAPPSELIVHRSDLTIVDKERDHRIGHRERDERGSTSEIFFSQGECSFKDPVMPADPLNLQFVRADERIGNEAVLQEGRVNIPGKSAVDRRDFEERGTMGGDCVTVARGKLPNTIHVDCMHLRLPPWRVYHRRGEFSHLSMEI